MKEKIFNIIIICTSLFFLIQLIINKTIIYTSIMYTLNIWVNSLIPTLFPFFVISDILITYNITHYFPKIIKYLCKKIFNITDNMLTILILSLISGFPSNARNIRTLYDNNMISLNEANHIIIFSHFSNPLFILTTISVFFLHNEKLGIILLLSHYLSNFILGILFKNKFNHQQNKNNYIKNINNFTDIFILTIKKAIDTTLLICGIIITFSIMSTIITNIFNLNGYANALIKGLFEITIGIQSISNLNLNITYKMVIISMMLAFGGLSVHMQVISQIIGTKIKYSYFLIGRIYQMLISGIITYIICLIILQ